MKRFTQFGWSVVAPFLEFFTYLDLKVVSDVVRRTARNRLPGLSAEIAYNAIFALFPVTLAVLSAIGLLEISEVNVRSFVRQSSEVIPDAALALIHGSLRQLRLSYDPRLFSFSFLLAMWASSSVIGAAMAALDQIQRIPRRLVRPFWRFKLVSLALSLGTFLLLVSALAIVSLSDVTVRVVAHRSGGFAHNLFAIWHWLGLPVALSIVALALGFIYRYGPSYWKQGTPVMPGAAFAAILWAVLSSLLRFYVLRFGNYNQIYGAVAAVVILLLWLYLSAFAMLLGNQLNVVVGEAMRRSAKADFSTKSHWQKPQRK